jgi:hypothetical protein
MTVGAALLLIAAGAVLRFAVSTVSLFGVNLHTIGDILMGVGVLGLVLWLVVWAPWARSRRTGYRPRDSYGQQPQAPTYPAQRQVPPVYPEQRQVPPVYPGQRQVPPVDARTRDLYRDDPYYQDRYRA